jgi:CTP:phosphocholine cytidylyltransferase-like protein
MHKTLLPKHLAIALEAGVEPLDVVQGHIKNQMYEVEQKLSEYTNQDDEQYDQTVDRLHFEGYQDCLTDLYLMCYDVIFYKQDLEKESG